MIPSWLRGVTGQPCGNWRVIVEIVILAMIAVFLGLRLYAVLGRRPEDSDEPLRRRLEQADPQATPGAMPAKLAEKAAIATRAVGSSAEPTAFDAWHLVSAPTAASSPGDRSSLLHLPQHQCLQKIIPQPPHLHAAGQRQTSNHRRK